MQLSYTHRATMFQAQDTTISAAKFCVMVGSLLGCLLFSATSILADPVEYSADVSVAVDLNPLNPELLFTATDGYGRPEYTYTSIPGEAPSGFESGLTTIVDRDSGLTVYCPVIATGPGVVYVYCAIYTSGPDAKLTLAALNVEDGDTLGDIDWSLASNQPADAARFHGGWHNLELYYDPEGDALAPIVQVLGTADAPVEIYIDRLIVTPLRNLSSEKLDAALNLPPVLSSVNIVGNDPKLYADESGRRFRTITAAVEPPVSGIPITFAIEDPDDPATDFTIDPNGSAGADNVGPSALLDGFEGPVTVFTDQGVASVIFSTKSKVGGDNYRVSATSQKQTLRTDVMTVWRKLFIEYDVMEDTPPEFADYGPQGKSNRSHAIHENYLTGKEHGLRAILEAVNDGVHQKNRCAYITPEIIGSANSADRTDFSEYVYTSGESLDSYHQKTLDNDRFLHLISAHLYDGPPDQSGTAGEGRLGRIFIFWDKVQYSDPNVDSGESPNLWLIGHETGHALGRAHHERHGEDDVAGAPGHDCLMTQAYPAPRLNLGGQTAKRFGPACVRVFRDRAWGIKGLE